jgi:CheY-like chemotaxis protein
MRVLFVDDDSMNRRVVRDMLVLAGVELDEAADGPTGLTMVDRHDYAVVLMDLRMRLCGPGATPNPNCRSLC